MNANNETQSCLTSSDENEMLNANNETQSCLTSSDENEMLRLMCAWIVDFYDAQPAQLAALPPGVQNRIRRMKEIIGPTNLGKLDGPSDK